MIGSAPMRLEADEVGKWLRGEDPSRIEALWHKIFRGMTYVGTRGATTAAISGIDLRHEFEVAAPRAGLTPGQTRQAQVNGLAMAFLPESEKTALRAARAARASTEESKR